MECFAHKVDHVSNRYLSGFLWMRDSLGCRGMVIVTLFKSVAFG